MSFKCDTEARLKECLDQYICGLITYYEMAYRLDEYNRLRQEGWDRKAKTVERALSPDCGLDPITGLPPG